MQVGSVATFCSAMSFKWKVTMCRNVTDFVTGLGTAPSHTSIDGLVPSTHDRSTRAFLSGSLQHTSSPSGSHWLRVKLALTRKALCRTFKSIVHGRYTHVASVCIIELKNVTESHSGPTSSIGHAQVLKMITYDYVLIHFSFTTTSYTAHHLPTRPIQSSTLHPRNIEMPQAVQCRLLLRPWLPQV